MKKSLFLLSILCIGCTTSEEADSQVIATAAYKKAIRHMHNENAIKVQWIEHSNLLNSYKDSMILKNAISLIRKSYDVLDKKATPADYYATLLEHYNRLEYKDTASLNRAKICLENFKQTKDSSNYYNAMLNLMNLEYDVIYFYCEQVGANISGPFTKVYKDKDTINVSETYTFVVTPALYNYKYSEIIVDSSPEITIDNKKTTVPIQTKKIGGTLTFTLTPTQKGKYYIKGKVFVKQKQSGYAAEESYSTSFVVK
ncbi:MAG: hypothetical protein ACTHJT_07425 [Cytophaga sp.]|uniref:hypothetical protein n=1 Tax=Cytophaga sp. TaxID=29535 RepID=UPI003F7F98B0